MAKLIFDNKEYPFRLELSAMAIYAEKKGIEELKTRDLGELMADADLLKDYPLLIWAGMKVGADEAGRTFVESPEVIKKWLRENPYQFDRAVNLINGDTKAPESGNEDRKAKENP